MTEIVVSEPQSPVSDTLADGCRVGAENFEIALLDRVFLPRLPIGNARYQVSLGMARGHCLRKMAFNARF